MKIEGKIFCLNQPNIDTDQIIPAIYLTGISMKGCGEHLFEGIPGFDRNDPNFKGASILVARENFGCGSSREHAVWALEGHGFKAVIAPSFARIFRQNMFNRGLLAIELTAEQIEEIFKTGFSVCEIDLDAMVITFSVPKLEKQVYTFQLSEFDKTLVLEGGLVEFIAKRY